jgi:hypothetical protein
LPQSGHQNACTNGQVFHSGDSESKSKTRKVRKVHVKHSFTILYNRTKAEHPVLGESFRAQNVPTVPSLSGPPLVSTRTGTDRKDSFAHLIG